MKGADGWESLTVGVRGSLTTGSIVNGPVVNDRVNDTFAFVFVLGGN